MAQQEILTSTVFLAGLASFFSPCIFPIIPIYLGILAKGGRKILNTFLFIFGLSLTFISLGFGAELLGDLFFNDNVRIIAGIIVILLGINQLGIIHVSFLERTKLVEIKGRGSLEAFFLGLTFSLGWTPCIGPILASVLTLSSNEQLAGVTMMAIYVLGLASPFVLFSIFSEKLLVKAKGLNKHLNKFKIFGGVLIIIMGVLLVINQIN